MDNFKFEILDEYKEWVKDTPQRASLGSAGYDLRVAETYTLVAGEKHVFHTGIRARFPRGYVLTLTIRSSYGIKKGIVLANQVGIIDSDYADAPETKGEILLCLMNTNPYPVTIKAGERVAQAILLHCFRTELDFGFTQDRRTGGIGSTGEE